MIVERKLNHIWCDDAEAVTHKLHACLSSEHIHHGHRLGRSSIQIPKGGTGNGKRSPCVIVWRQYGDRADGWRWGRGGRSVAQPRTGSSNQSK